MSTSGRTDDGTASADSDAAVALGDAEFVRVLARADGDCLAAAGVLARALEERGVPYQIRVARFGETFVEASDDDADGDTTVAVGLDAAADVRVRGGTAPASVTAYDAASELGASPDPALALAGVVAAGHPPGAGESAHVYEAARAAGLERRPGVCVPTDDLADGLAHTTLAHADYSGDVEAAQATLAELGLPAELEESARRTVASELALAVTGADGANDRAADAVARSLRPHELPDGPFATLEGYADVLDAVARARPSTGLALALGHDARADALDAWRDHASAAHRALREATTGRYDGLFVARVGDVSESETGDGSSDGRSDGAPVGTVARLLRDFRSPEPVALVVGNGAAAAAATEVAADDGTDVGATIAEAAAAVGGRGDGTARHGYATFDAETDVKEFLGAFREAAT